jgi:hypothetical protein
LVEAEKYIAKESQTIANEKQKEKSLKEKQKNDDCDS